MAEVLPALNSTIKGNKIHWGSLAGSSEPVAIAETAAAYDGMLLVITTSSAEAIRLEQEVGFFLAAESDIPVIHFPDWETLAYDTFSPHQDIISERLQALHQLPRQRRERQILHVRRRCRRSGTRILAGASGTDRYRGSRRFCGQRRLPQ